ncbi:MAG: hypothetical protein HN337_09265 [Deltaproteobacteria bacterium]|jgi:hypothetical protein|nr:hypothetical protein [Deltaproteobacteria bacterium]
MTKDKASELGTEILSYCGRCKIPLNHLIHSVTKTGKPDRCECQTCGALHKYRNPDKPVKPRGKAGPKKEKVSIETLWKEAVAAAGENATPYAMSGNFAEGELMDHSTFGKGVVQTLINHTKIKVIFQDAEKILVQNR